MLQDNRTCTPKTPDSPALGEIAIKKTHEGYKKKSSKRYRPMQKIVYKNQKKECINKIYD